VQLWFVGLIQRITSRLISKRATEGTLPKNFNETAEAVLRSIYGNPHGGLKVTNETAMRIATVYACVRVISESVAQLPIKIYRPTASGPEEVRDHPAARLLKREPNGWQTAFEFREMMQGYSALRGNGFAVVEREAGTNRPLSLIPMNPTRVEVFKTGTSVAYRVRNDRNEARIVNRYDMLHYRGLSSDGFIGESPVSLMRNVFGLAATLEQTSASMFANGAKPAGVLEHPQQLSDEAAKRIKATFDSSFGGSDKVGSTLVLEEGMKWSQVGLSFEDAQLLESKKFSVEEIARAFRVPLHMLQSTEKSTSWGTGIEQMTLGFIMFTLGPWLKRTEETNDAVLLTEKEKDEGYYHKHNINALLRGDFKTRMDGYAVGLLNGIYSINEVRRLEEMMEIPDNEGGMHRVPLNTIPAGQKQPVNADASAPQP
jgi:HK97 family phage portal protein